VVCAAPVLNSLENRTLINADAADKSKNQRNLRHLRPFLSMVVRRGHAVSYVMPEQLAA
jgi:hypothetical protein